jgi:hypothetical protein
LCHHEKSQNHASFGQEILTVSNSPWTKLETAFVGKAELYSKIPMQGEESNTWRLELGTALAELTACSGNKGSSQFHYRTIGSDYW